MTTDAFDIAVIGAGIAGAGIAAELAPHARVVVLEAEDTPGYHATGRSAAFWEECYGGPELVPLTLASGRFLREGGYLNRRGALYIAREADSQAIERFLERFTNSGATIERLGRDALARQIPGLRSDWTQAIWEPACADIDVAALHGHYLKHLRKGGAELRLRSRVRSLERSGERWGIETEDGARIFAATVVNAAGAWADTLAGLAGVTPIGIEPLRRTVAQLRVDPVVSHDLPLTLDINGQFYFRPEHGKLWLSPHDEVPSEPCDAAPEELAVAEAIDRLQDVVDWNIEAVEHKWAGLRSFAPDRLPVYGFDPDVEGFFWLAGQGGSGIQTAPAAVRLAAQLLLGHPRDAMTDGIDASLYDPVRFRRATP